MQHLIGTYGLGKSSDGLDDYAVDALQSGSAVRTVESKLADAQFRQLTPVRTTLRMLASPRQRPYFDRLMTETAAQGLADDDVCAAVQPRENKLLLAVSGSIRVGLIEFVEGYWRHTWFGGRVISGSYLVGVDGFLRGDWLFEMWRDYEVELSWAWDTLSAERGRKYLSLLVDSNNCFKHSELPSLDDNDNERNQQLRVLAAAAAVGAMAFSGWRWRATLYGLWLANDPQSPLSRRGSSE